MDIAHSSKKYYSKLLSLRNSEILPGILLLIATIIALIFANTSMAHAYHNLFDNVYILPGINLHAFINDFLMAIFFLAVGCEIKKEIVSGHLSNLKKASFPIVAAFGGVIVPAIIYFIFNMNSSYKNGIGVPISTDIAFAVAAFMIFKNKLNKSLKIFLLTLAVVDDLISIIVIGVFYSDGIKLIPLALAGIIFLLLLNMKRINKSGNLVPYFILGLFLWIFVYLSGVHATISGVLLAMTLPIAKCNKDTMECALIRVEHKISPYANLIILPLFALSNTAISLDISSVPSGSITVVLGIVVGLVVGKPLGIMLFTTIASKLHLVERPKDVTWKSLVSVGMLAGIGFTMSIFVSEIAFSENVHILNIVKISILLVAIITCLIASISINYLLPKNKA